ncbi:MAG: NfeD family protein [Desulfobacterales bacterium]
MGWLIEWINPPLIWFMAGLVLVLMEFVNPGIVMIFFGVGAWVVAFVLLFTGISLNMQLSIFLIVSILLLLFLRKWLKTLIQGRSVSSDAEQMTFDQFFGRKAVVTHAVTPETPGRVEFQGSYWKAESTETIAQGASVEIIDKNNITLIVKPA